MALDLNQRTATAHLIYQLEDRPAPGPSLLAAVQHLLASLVGIVTPTLVIGGALGLGEHLPYLISMSLFVSGVCTFIQSNRIGPVGSGLLSLQGTSFGFLGAIMTAGMVAKARGDTPEQILALIFGLCLAGCVIEIILSQFLDKLKKILTPTVTGIVITVIGLSLIKVAVTDMAGGFGSPNFGSLGNMGLALVVTAVIVGFSFAANGMLRLTAMLIGLAVGFAIAAATGQVDFSQVGSQPIFALPQPLKFGLSFDWGLFIPIAFMYLITAIETVGDTTANSVISGQPSQGPVYMKRLKGAILGDGINSGIASIFNTFPNTTFSQNNGVIQLTGVASRHVSRYISGLLILLGLFPIISGLFTLIPKPVLGGATLVLFGSIAVAGIRILSSQPIDRKSIYVMAVSFGFGLGVTLVPDALKGLPDGLRHVFSSPITVSGLMAIVLTLILPEMPAATSEDAGPADGEEDPAKVAAAT